MACSVLSGFPVRDYLLVQPCRDGTGSFSSPGSLPPDREPALEVWMWMCLSQWEEMENFKGKQEGG